MFLEEVGDTEFGMQRVHQVVEVGYTAIIHLLSQCLMLTLTVRQTLQLRCLRTAM